MASVTVFVDDAVTGDLPPVCVRDGVPTRDALGRSEEIGNRAGLGVAWLLLLAGPIGWLGLLAISLSRSGRVEALRVELPMSEAAYRRMRSARRTRDRCAMGLLIAAVAGLFVFVGTEDTVLTQFAVLAAGFVAVVSLVGMLVASIRFDRETVDVSLDASRRWVTLSNVHPAFATACQERAARRRDRAYGVGEVPDSP